MAIQLPLDEVDTTLNNLPLLLTGGDPAGFVHDFSLGLIQIQQDQTDGHVQNISANGLLFGAGVDFEDDPSQHLGAPVQLDGTLVNGSPLDGLSGRNVEGITLTGPVELQADYGDNAGGFTDSFATIGGDLLQTTLLEGYGDRSPEGLSLDSPLVGLDTLWGSFTNAPPTSSIAVGDLADAVAFAGPGGVNSLDSVAIDGLLNGNALFGPSSEQFLVPIILGNEDDFLHGVLIESLGDQTLQSITLDGIGGVGELGGADLALDHVLDGSALGLLDNLLHL